MLDLERLYAERVVYGYLVWTRSACAKTLSTGHFRTRN